MQQLLSIIVPIICGYITLIFLDFIWLGFVTKSFIIREFHILIELNSDGSIKIQLFAGMLAWLAIVLLVYVFVIHSGLANSYQTALMYGAIIGFLSYAMYDLTNLTFLRGYSLQFTLVDIGWGTVLCGLVALSMYTAKQFVA